jgi:hypothetical protein
LPVIPVPALLPFCVSRYRTTEFTPTRQRN